MSLLSVTMETDPPDAAVFCHKKELHNNADEHRHNLLSFFVHKQVK